MATTRLSPQKKRGPMVLLSAAICEWFLLFLLFIDATFSYILRRFAKYSDLPTPCLFCSRIDTPFGKRKFEGYNALLCRSHKEEVSSLVSCSAHGNLTDVREMCEECFNPGSLTSEIEQHSVQKNLPPSGPWICRCCNKSWGAKPIAQRFLEMAPVRFAVSVANVKPPLPQVPGRSRLGQKNSSKKLRNRFSAPATPQTDGMSLGDALSHVGYKELKYTSDSEPELPFSDEQEVLFGVRGRNAMNPEPNPHHLARTLLKLQTNDSALEKESNHSVADVTSLLDQPMQLATQESLPTHGLEHLNWDQLHQKPADSQKEISTTSVEQPPASDSTEFEEIKSVIQQSAPKQNDFPDVAASSSDGNHVQAVASLDRNDSSLKRPVASLERNDSSVKLSVRSLERNDSSLKLPVASLERNDSSVKLSVRSLERNDSSLKFSDRLNLSDVEGETSVDVLKNQLEHVKKCMNDLYKELEEERNASAVAANQAMAMITRLQEEKAALHMEASQYLRMMDEQAEYDVDALQKANDLLAEKEKQLQDMEYEVESYRNNIHGEPSVIDPHNGSTSTMEQNTTGDLSIRLNGSITCEPSSSGSSKLSISDDIPGYAKNTMSNLEEEKLSLHDYLKKLERTMHVVSRNNTPRAGLNNSRHPGLNPNTTDFQENPPTNDEDKSEKEAADGLTMQHWLSVVDRDSDDSPISQFDDSDAYCEETNHNRSNWQNLSIAGHEPTMETFENEIAQFKERLKAFEGDWEFIKHSLKNFKVDMKGWNIFNR